MTTVRPGIYLRGDVDYAAIDAINFSTLKYMAQSPRHYLHALKHGTVETPSMGRGTAGHIAALEPERFALEYAIFDGKRRAGKAWDEFKADADSRGLRVLKEADLHEAFEIRDAVRADAAASAYLSNGHAEVTVVWQDEETGLLCKGRVDFLRNDCVVSDLKISADVEPFMFGRSCARLQYHVQAAMYVDGLEAVTKQAHSHRIIAVESKRPHDVIVYRLGEDVLGPGRDAYRSMLAKVKECRQEKYWPGRSGGLELPFELPPWALGETEDDLASLGLE